MKPEVYERLGTVRSIDIGIGAAAILNFRHVYKVTGWEGVLRNPEGKNEYIEVTLKEARVLCKHPISQKILDLVEASLSRKNG